MQLHKNEEKEDNCELINIRIDLLDIANFFLINIGL